MDIAQADYASATFKALIIQGFLRFWGIEKRPLGAPLGNGAGERCVWRVCRSILAGAYGGR